MITLHHRLRDGEALQRLANSELCGQISTFNPWDTTCDNINTIHYAGLLTLWYHLKILIRVSTDLARRPSPGQSAMLTPACPVTYFPSGSFLIVPDRYSVGVEPKRHGLDLLIKISHVFSFQCCFSICLSQSSMEVGDVGQLFAPCRQFAAVVHRLHCTASMRPSTLMRHSYTGYMIKRWTQSSSTMVLGLKNNS